MQQRHAGRLLRQAGGRGTQARHLRQAWRGVAWRACVACMRVCMRVATLLSLWCGMLTSPHLMQARVHQLMDPWVFGAVRCTSPSAGTPIDGSVDIYAFGVTMYMLYTRRAPYRGTDVEAVQGKVVRGMRPEMPPETPIMYRQACPPLTSTYRHTYRSTLCCLQCAHMFEIVCRGPPSQAVQCSAQLPRVVLFLAVQGAGSALLVPAPSAPAHCVRSRARAAHAAADVRSALSGPLHPRHGAQLNARRRSQTIVPAHASALCLSGAPPPHLTSPHLNPRAHLTCTRCLLSAALQLRAGQAARAELLSCKQMFYSFKGVKE